MCLSVPAKIIEIANVSGRQYARVDHEGNVLRVDISLIDNPTVGDYVLLHAGIAIDKYDPEIARETLKLHERISDILRGEKTQ